MLLLVALVAVSTFAAKEHRGRLRLEFELSAAEKSNSALRYHLHNYIQGLPPSYSQKTVNDRIERGTGGRTAGPKERVVTSGDEIKQPNAPARRILNDFRRFRLTGSQCAPLLPLTVAIPSSPLFAHTKQSSRAVVLARARCPTRSRPPTYPAVDGDLALVHRHLGRAARAWRSHSLLRVRIGSGAGAVCGPDRGRRDPRTQCVRPEGGAGSADRLDAAWASTAS